MIIKTCQANLWKRREAERQDADTLVTGAHGAGMDAHMFQWWMSSEVVYI